MDTKRIAVGTIVVAEFEAFDNAVILTKIEQGKKSNEGYVLFGGNHLIDPKDLKPGQRVELEFAEGGVHGGHWRIRRLWNRHKGVINPTIIIDPPSLKAEDLWNQCKTDVEKYGIDTHRGAACADPGVCDCPNCHQDYWYIGNLIQCTECRFKFPTDAWAMYSWGVQAKWRGETDFVTQAKVRTHPYFAYGYNNPPPMDDNIDLFALFNWIDWKTEVGDTEKVLKRSELMAICERCGTVKTGHREHSTELCVECESQTTCRHYRPEMPIVFMDDGQDYVCQAGVSLQAIAGENGRIQMAMLPCRFCTGRDGKQPAKCEKFTSYTLAEIAAHDAEIEQEIQRFIKDGWKRNSAKDD